MWLFYIKVKIKNLNKFVAYVNQQTEAILNFKVSNNNNLKKQ